MPLSKEERKALRTEAKQIQAEFARAAGSDAESRARRQALEQRYREINTTLQNERRRVLGECWAIWREYVAIDRSEMAQVQRAADLMEQYQHLYHVLRKDKPGEPQPAPGSIEDIPSPEEMGEGARPPARNDIGEMPTLPSPVHQGAQGSGEDSEPSHDFLPIFEMEEWEPTPRQENDGDEEDSFIIPSLNETSGQSLKDRETAPMERPIPPFLAELPDNLFDSGTESSPDHDPMATQIGSPPPGVTEDTGGVQPNADNGRPPAAPAPKPTRKTGLDSLDLDDILNSDTPRPAKHDEDEGDFVPKKS